jgi:hypothetical protein
VIGKVGFDKYLTVESDECSIATSADHRDDGLVQLHSVFSTINVSTIMCMIAFVHGTVLKQSIGSTKCRTQSRDCTNHARISARSRRV